MTTVKSYLSSEELEARYETAGDPIAKSPFHALWLLSKGYDLDDVAELLSFLTRWVYQLVRRYNAGGPDCLGDERANNVPLHSDYDSLALNSRAEARTG